MSGRWLYRVAGGWVALVFLAASLPKLAAPQDFALALFRYHLVPGALINAAAILVPWMELTAAVALLWAPAYRRAAALLLGGLLVVFTAALVIDLGRGLDIACGCFSVKPTFGHIGAWSLVRNAALLALAGLAAGEPRAEGKCPD